MNTKSFEQFEVMTDAELAKVEGGDNLNAAGVIVGIAWGIYSFGEAAGKTAYYMTHPK